MSRSRRYPPNRRLTWERLQRGWSYEELTNQICASMASCGDPDTGLVANTARRWETGERWPEPRFRKHLVLLFDKPASELGLLTPDELALRPDDSPIDQAENLLTLVHGDTRMRALIHARPTTAPDARSVDGYAAIAAHQRELYWTAPAPSLFGSSLAHTRLGSELLGGAAHGETRQDLASALAESALLTARLAFFDLRQPGMAQDCFDVARQASEIAGDHALAAAVYAHMSFVPGFAGDGDAACSLLDAAYAHARYRAGPGLRSWLHCVSAEIAARTGDAEGSLRHVRQAQESLAASGEDPVWLDFYDATRLPGFAGHCHLLAGRHSEAAPSLEAALSGLHPQAVKQRAVLLFDLATAHAHEDAERASTYVSQAFDALESNWYSIAYDRISVVRKALADTPYAADLEERRQALPHAGH